VKGYEISRDRYVIVEPEELDALDPEATRSIDLEQFVELAEVDPLLYDSAYYLVPDKGAVRPYALLLHAMGDESMVGVARFVMRQKQYVAMIRPSQGHLVLSTMIYADEVVPATSLTELEEVERVELADRELKMARTLVESLAGPFVHEAYRDEYRDRVLELIERKAAGEEELVAPAPAATAPKVVDLMAALEASVAAAKESRKRHPTARPAEAPAAGAPEAAEAADDAPAKPARKRAAKKAAAEPVAAAPRRRKSA
jgi:DNA end-binding protein Ku